MTLLEALIIKYIEDSTWAKEDFFQMATARVLDALAADYLLAWFHASPNVYRRALQANRVKAMRAGALGKKLGVKAGVFDCIIYSHKLAIELKQPKGSISQDQKDWATLATHWGWTCIVAKKSEQVISALADKKILGGINYGSV